MNDRLVRMILGSWLLVAVLVVSPRISPVWAEDAASGPVDAQTLEKWKNLSSEEKQELRERHRKFKAMDADKQQLIRENFHKYEQLPSEEKERVRQNWRRYKDLPPEQREQMKRKYEHWRSLSPEDRQRMSEKMKQLRQLPPEKRKRLEERRKEWQSLSPEQKEERRQSFEQKRRGAAGEGGAFKERMQERREKMRTLRDSPEGVHPPYRKGMGAGGR